MRYSVVLFVTLVIVSILCIYPTTTHAHNDSEVDSASEHQAHNCVHDTLKDKIVSIQAPQKYPEADDGEHAKRGLVSDKTPANSATSTIRAPFESMRITVNTSLLMNDRGASCYRVNDFAKVGKPAGKAPTPMCGGSRNEDCWKKCEEADVLTEEKIAFIEQQLIPHAVEYLQSILKTTRMTENLVIPKGGKGTCGENVDIPEYFSNEGIPETDLALLVTGRPTMQHTIAWAIECAADQTGRPVFGLINVGPASLKNLEKNLDYYFRVVVHEMTHVLGFNNGKFEQFTNPQTGKKYPRVTVQTTTPQGVRVDKIVTPKALAAAREHFGCPQLDGVLLEDGGGHSTSKSHWEKRVFRNEYMTGTSDQHSVFSKITLAFLEDMGWYEVDYSQAELLDWGKGMGCRFVTGSCKDWNSYGYFCDQPEAKSCTSNRNSIGYCNLSKKTKVPPAFRYFADLNLGGMDELADFCPFVQAYSNGLCTDVNNRPKHAEILGSSYGPDSRCFESSLALIGYTSKEEMQPICYDFRCSGNALEVKVGRDWLSCPPNGILESVAGYNGILKCPDSSFCRVQNANKALSHSPSKQEGSASNPAAESKKKSNDVEFDYSLFMEGGDSAEWGGGSGGFGFFSNGAEIIKYNYVVVGFVLIALYLF